MSYRYEASPMVLITPQITVADDDIRSLSIATRKCYFEGEKKLHFYKIYTQKNCEMECLSDASERNCRTPCMIDINPHLTFL
jgi:amiloride-sensitive sodium channel